MALLGIAKLGVASLGPALLGSARLGIAQSRAFRFVTTWNTATAGVSAADQITLPFIATGEYDCTVYWGDGTKDRITAWNDPALIHTYPSSGIYTPFIVGKVIGWSFNNGGDRLKIDELSQWGSLVINTPGAFYGCGNITITATDLPTLIGDMTDAFRGIKIDTLALTNWPMALVTIFDSIIRGANLLSGTVEGWDTSAGTSFINVNRFSATFNSPIAWSTPLGESFAGFLHNATIFAQSIITLSFASCLSLEGFARDARAFPGPMPNDTGLCTTFKEMLRGAWAFKQSLANMNIASLTDATDMMRSGSGLPTAEYDATLVGWQGQPHQPNVVVNFGSSKYTAGGAGKAAKDLLVLDGWTILDSGAA